ncbi:MAG: DNRLRE domain-containing protein [Christensenellales bacterium]
MKIKKIIICLLLTMLISLGTTSLAKSEQDMAEAQSVIQDAERSFELMELRENNSKTYLLKDGTYEYVGYAEDIHYKDADGKLKEIDNAITDKPRKDGYTYSNTANAWHTYFAECLCKKNAVVIEKDDYKITFSMVDAKTQSRAMKSSALDKSESIFDKVLACDNRAVVYKDAMKNVDVAYTVTTCGLKEDILLRNASATNIFKFDFTLDGLSVFEKEGIVSFVNGGGEHIFELAPMYMEDANGKYCDKVSYTIEENHDSYILTIIADKEFLNAPDTQFPVIIDPSIMITGATDTFDTYVDQEYPTKNYYLATAQWTGGQYGINAMRTYIKFNLPTNIPAANISSAYLRIERISYAAPTIKAYRVTGNWASSSVTWNNKPGYTSTYASATAYNDSGNWYRMNATTMVKHWIDGVYSNYGFVLKEPSESDTNQKTRFYSSDASSPHKPELHIVFSSYDYYGCRPYETQNSTGINCAGYALDYPSWINFGITLDGLNNCSNEAELWTYTKNKVSSWLSSNMPSEYRSISSYNSYIYSNDWRVVLRIGYKDDGDGIVDIDNLYNDYYDFHWWYQTNTGQWAEKPGQTPSHLVSGTSGSTNPYYVSWPCFGYSSFYNSICKYYEIAE